MTPRGDVTLPVIATLAGLGLVTMTALQMPPEHVWQSLVAIFGQGGATALVLYAWHKLYVQKKGTSPNGWDSAKVFAELERLHKETRELLASNHTALSKDVANAITLALKDIELLMEKYARERERRSG